MAFAPSASWNSRSITHLANYPSLSSPTISSDESYYERLIGKNYVALRTGLGFYWQALRRKYGSSADSFMGIHNVAKFNAITFRLLYTSRIREHFNRRGFANIRHLCLGFHGGSVIQGEYGVGNSEPSTLVGTRRFLNRSDIVFRSLCHAPKLVHRQLGFFVDALGAPRKISGIRSLVFDGLGHLFGRVSLGVGGDNEFIGLTASSLARNSDCSESEARESDINDGGKSKNESKNYVYRS